MRTVEINSNAKENLNILLAQMKSKTKTKLFNNDCNFSTIYVSGGILRSTKNGIYNSSLSGKTSTARLNGRDYIINTETGTIKAEKPSLRERLLGISRRTVKIISKTITQVKENFENNDIVEQYSWEVDGFTPKGAERLMKIADEIQKNKRERL